MPIETVAGVSKRNTVVCVFLLKEDLSGVRRVFLKPSDVQGNKKIPVKKLSLFKTISGVSNEATFVKSLLVEKCKFVEVEASAFNTSRVPKLQECLRDLRKKRN